MIGLLRVLTIFFLEIQTTKSLSNKQKDCTSKSYAAIELDWNKVSLVVFF